VHFKQTALRITASQHVDLSHVKMNKDDRENTAHGEKSHPDRGPSGVSSAGNERAARQAGVEKTALPKRGAKDAERQAYEAQPWFKAALHFRAGIERRISGLKRARGLDRCRNKGEPGMERWLGWGILANNLAVKAAQLVRRRRSARTTAT
jgi:IS5 family transposase